MSSRPPAFASREGLQKPVCVFCGSSPGTSDLYAKVAQSVGRALAQSDTPLVYGGGRRGIMGVVSQAALSAGGYVHGILPRALQTRAMTHTSIPDSAAPGSAGSSSQPIKSGEGKGADILDEDNEKLSLEMVDSMHERKLRFAQLSTGGFVVLPGGYGTFEEMFEMITWNQLGIHRVPVAVLNVGGFYTPLRAMLKTAVEAGFIYPENLSLVHIVDLDSSDISASSDSARSAEWGQVTLNALKEFSFAEGSGYGFSWTQESNKDTAETGGSASASVRPLTSLFSTARYTSTLPASPVTRERVPLWQYHVMRLREAHTFFSERDGLAVWGEWPGDDALWDHVRIKLEEQDRAGPGDWRIRILIHPHARTEIQVIRAPQDILPFACLPATLQPEIRKPVVLDEARYYRLETETDQISRRFKTTCREVYDAASQRGDALTGGDHTEVLIHDGTRVMETTISNVALQIPSTDGGSALEWVTPRLEPATLPFLNGVMRRYLLEQGVIREGEVTLDHWEQCRVTGRRVIVFNGLRGVVEAAPS